MGFQSCLKVMCGRLGRVMLRSSTNISLHYLHCVCLQGLHGCVYWYDLQLMLMVDNNHTL